MKFQTIATLAALSISSTAAASVDGPSLWPWQLKFSKVAMEKWVSLLSKDIVMQTAYRKGTEKVAHAYGCPGYLSDAKIDIVSAEGKRFDPASVDAPGLLYPAYDITGIDVINFVFNVNDGACGSIRVTTGPDGTDKTAQYTW